MNHPTHLSRHEHRHQLDELRRTLNRSLLGKEAVIELVLACLLARGHLLLEDLPGLGKTTLAKALASAIGGTFSRVQCTPDLLPGDITGFSIFNQETRAFEFRPGPIFADVVLADEINRATPRAQSALLEAMAERQVTVDNVKHNLSPVSFVIATQNPVEHHGTYPLPEAQLDRFAMKLSIGYPAPTDEIAMLQGAVGEAEPDKASVSLFRPGELHALQQQVVKVAVTRSIQEYLVHLATTTRSHKQVALGLSPRGLLTWQRVAQARAYLQERTFVTPDDVQDVAVPVLGVRFGLDAESTTRVIEEIVASVAVPTQPSTSAA